MINMNWLYSNALGGVRLLVLEQFAQEAYELIHQNLSDELNAEFDLEVERCPNCGSEELYPFTQGKRKAFTAFLLLGFPIARHKHGMKCAKCDYFIED